MNGEAEKKSSGCGCGTLFFGLIVVGGIGSTVEWYLDLGPAPTIYVINGRDGDVDLYIDGDRKGTFGPLQPGTPVTEGVGVWTGERTVMLRAGDEVIFEEVLEFERGWRYIAYSGGRWLLRSEVYYTTHDFMNTGSDDKFRINGEEAYLWESLNSANDDEDLTHVELWSKPMVTEFVGFLPGETIPGSVDVETLDNVPFASATRSVFELLEQSHEPETGSEPLR